MGCQAMSVEFIKVREKAESAFSFKIQEVVWLETSEALIVDFESDANAGSRD